MKCIPLTCGYFLLILPLPSLYILLSCSPSILFCLVSFFFSGICIPLCYWYHLIPLLCCLFIFWVENTWAVWCLITLLWFCAEGQILSWDLSLTCCRLCTQWLCTKSSAAPRHDPRLLLHSPSFILCYTSFISFCACFVFYILLILLLFALYFPLHLTLFCFVVSSYHS